MAASKTPEAIKVPIDSKITDSWLNYTVAELGNWVHLFMKRAQHRGYEAEKRAKDLCDARIYWRMIGKHLNAMDEGSLLASGAQAPSAIYHDIPSWIVAEMVKALEDIAAIDERVETISIYDRLNEIRARARQTLLIGEVHLRPLKDWIGDDV